MLALFPGQGSQKTGMGKDLCAESPRARDYFQRADSALGFSLSSLCFEGPDEKLTQTAIAQPAILTVSTICFALAREKWGAALHVVSGAGHSLGEYSALVAANAISFEEAVVLVHKRGIFMQDAVPLGAGKMVAILGVPLQEIEQICGDIGAREGQLVEIANINTAEQVVVAGRAESIELLVNALAGKKIIPLQVSAPFHCALMKPAADRLSAELLSTTITPASFPVYGNESAAAQTSPEGIRTALGRQVCGRVRWVECMLHAIQETSPSIAIEFGSGNVLTNMLKRIAKEVPRANIDSVKALETITLH